MISLLYHGKRSITPIIVIDHVLEIHPIVS
jgi:hypothetical protein